MNCHELCVPNRAPARVRTLKRDAILTDLLCSDLGEHLPFHNYEVLIAVALNSAMSDFSSASKRAYYANLRWKPVAIPQRSSM